MAEQPYTTASQWQPPNPAQYQGMNQLQSLLGQFQDSWNQTQQANQQRANQIGKGYGDYAGGYSQLAQQLMGQLGNIGQSQRDKLTAKFEKQKAGQTQDLINRGLYNSTALDAAQRGLSRDQQEQQLALEDMLTRQQLEYGAKLGGSALEAMLPGLKFQEGIDETGPSYGDLAQVMQLYGQGNAQVPPWLQGLESQGPGIPAGPTLPSGQQAPSSPTPQYPTASRFPSTYQPLPDYGRPPGGLTSTGGFFNQGGGGGGGGSGGGGSGGGGYDWGKWETGWAGKGFETGWAGGGKEKGGGQQSQQAGDPNQSKTPAAGNPQPPSRVLTKEETDMLRDFGDPDFDLQGGGTVPAMSPSGNLIGYWPKGVWDYIQKQSGGNPSAAGALEQQFRSYMKPVSSGASTGRGGIQ